MWNKLKDIFSPETYEEGITSNSAIAAILVRASKTDNDYSDSEKKLIDSGIFKKNIKELSKKKFNIFRKT